MLLVVPILENETLTPLELDEDITELEADENITEDVDNELEALVALENSSTLPSEFGAVEMTQQA
jgi:hypothetical protein